jgi:HEAT repeat protein
MLRTAVLISLSLWLGAATARAQESDSAAVRERAEAYLGAIDRPVPASAWQALGPDAVPFLEEALQTDPITSRRAAAASGLAAIGGERAVEALLAAAHGDTERWSVRSAAVRGLGKAMSPDLLPGALRPILEGTGAVAVRALAADVLSRQAPATACSAIRAQVAREATSERAAFAKATSRCRGR